MKTSALWKRAWLFEQLSEHTVRLRPSLIKQRQRLGGKIDRRKTLSGQKETSTGSDTQGRWEEVSYLHTVQRSYGGNYLLHLLTCTLNQRLRGKSSKSQSKKFWFFQREVDTSVMISPHVQKYLNKFSSITLYENPSRLGSNSTVAVRCWVL